MKKQFCKKCKIIVRTGDSCPLCKSKNLTTTYYGMVSIIHPESSHVAKKLGITEPGDYALKVR
ncbi:MAG TPA: DNA-directed RNA polymerase subunit E'' [Candidatus Woesearchaeota archaeon]|nr:DNA-directed RNA polymerase subunit E'' [Candidatus Woesearchaeota archaeon]